MEATHLPKTDLRYWLTLLSACAIGETLGDFFSKARPKFVPLYWGTIILVALFMAILVGGKKLLKEPERAQ